MDSLFKELSQFPLTHRTMLEQSLYLIPLFPFLGFLLNGLFGRRMSKQAAGAVAVLAAAASFVWALLCVLSLDKVPGVGNESDHHTRNILHSIYGHWLSVEGFSCSFGLYLDQLSSVMILVVTGIGTLIHLYSMGYMAHDAGLQRFFAYLNLFLFAMILLVLGDNLILMFVGWEGVGLCSYLLIGFWFEDGKNAAAGMKAFVVNRIGDLGFILGIFTLIAIFGTVDYVAQPEHPLTPRSLPLTSALSPRGEGLQRVTYQTHMEDGIVEIPKKPGLLDYGDAIRLLANNHPEKNHIIVGEKAAGSNLDLSQTLARSIWPGWSMTFALTLACALLFIGAMGKSAQIPLYVWLPDAMAGPTPVSALIHAATMVTAGIYMVVRLYGLFSVSEEALQMIAVIGGCTALLSALIGLTQLDIKKVLAYSTVSQLGYMFLGLGVGAFSLGIFHVVTHAFFKALLFLGAGSVIHAMSGEQDMRYMGGLWKKLPVTFWTMLIGALALAGFPYFSGWYSKDEILVSVLARYEETHQPIFLVLYVFAVTAAFCTAFYTFRLIGLTFFAENRAKPDVQAHIHESPAVMTLPLIVLAVFSVIGGMLWHNQFTTNAETALGIINVSAEPEHATHHLNFIITLVIALGGIALALALYGRGRRIPNPDGSKNFFYRMSLNKFYVDEVYHALIITPFVIGAELAHWIIDMLMIDLLVTGSAYAVSGFSNVLRRIQTGVLNSYAFAILTGALAVLLYFLRTR